MISKISKLFPNNLISGTVKKQKELDDAFIKYPNLSKTYVQTALYWEDVRKWYEDNWPKVYKYLDNNFIDRFQAEEEHYSRAWEFHLAYVLLDKGFNLEEKIWKIGPDFCIKISSEKKLWIEAITCDLGETDPVEPHPDMKPGEMYSFHKSIEDVNRTRALRITNAIGTKFEIFKDYLKDPNSEVDKNDCLLIAINGATIQHFSNQSALLKRSVFGQGPDVFVKVQGQEKLKGGFYKPTPTITKKSSTSEQEIPATFMEMDEFSKISAVLYCGNTAYQSLCCGINFGDDFLFAYHTNPDNLIPKDLFKFGRGIRKDIDTGSVSDKEQG